MACCANRKHYYSHKDKIVLLSNHGRPLTITKELIEEISKHKVVETANSFNQQFIVNSRKRRRDDSFFEKIKKFIGFIEDEQEIGLPEGIEELNLGYVFNKPIDNLPSTIKKIKFGKDFNQLIDKLPQNVQKIKFEYKGVFNQPIDNLPSNLEFLELSTSFNHPLQKLPNSLKYLRIGREFDQELDNLPDSIEKLVLPNSYLREIKKFPMNLKQIVVSRDYPFEIPDHIQKKQTITIKFYKINPSSNVAYLKEMEQTKSIEKYTQLLSSKTILVVFLAP